MTALRYNPLTYSKKLKESGMEERLADIIAQQQEEMVMINDENHATKNDLRMLELRMTIKVGTMMVIQAGLIIAILQFLKP